jgi:hypothetical protein
MRRSLAAVVAAAITLVAMALIVERGGVLAWAGSVAGVTLLLKILVRPAASDLGISIATVVAWALAWAGTIYYVISTWESGEVVELGIHTPNGMHTARVWVLDDDAWVVLVYDAAPEIAEAMMSGNPIRLERNGRVSTGHAVATPVADMPQAEVSRIFQLMDDKYGRRNLATDVFYRFLGRSRDRVVMMVKLAR